MNYPVLDDALVAELQARDQHILAYLNGHQETPETLQAMLLEMQRWQVRAFLTDEVELAAGAA